MTAETATAEQLCDLTLEQANRVITLAETYGAHLTRTLGADPDAERVAQDVQSGASPAAVALVAAIDGLSRDARYELVALVWCGMGEYPFVDARAYAQATKDTGIASYLAKKALALPGYLRAALEALGV